MANKVLKVKLWDGEDGKKWKSSVRDIEGEVLLGEFMLMPVTLPISRHSNHQGGLSTKKPSLRFPNTNTYFPPQSHNSPSSPQQKKATNPTSTSPPHQPKAENCTSTSSATSALSTRRTVSKTVSSVQ